MIRALLRLFRPRLALLNGVSAVGGGLLFPGEPENIVLWASFGGVAFLAAGGSALNQVLERDLDRLMVRTRLRPLPQGQLTPVSATAIGIGAILLGLTLLVTVNGLIPALLGTAALAWYLFVYTPLKRRTPLALMVGALSGALAPVIGWCLAGGRPSDYRVVMLAGLLYLWQIPHFWLLQRRHADDYRNAGIPMFGTSEKCAGYLGVWIMALIAAAMLLPALGIIGQQVSAWYAIIPLPLFAMAILRLETTLFSYLNIFPLLITMVLCFSKLQAVF